MFLLTTGADAASEDFVFQQSDYKSEDEDEDEEEDEDR